MAEVKNKDVMHQIKSMLESLQEEDPKQVKIILNLLQEVVKEYNSGRSMGIERKLYDMIDGETFETKKRGK